MTWLRRNARTRSAGDDASVETTPRAPGTARRRIAVGLTALAVWVAGSALGSPGTPHAQALPSFAIGRAHPAEAFPALTGKKPIFVLALGSDARPGQPIDHERSVTSLNAKVAASSARSASSRTPRISATRSATPDGPTTGRGSARLNGP